MTISDYQINNVIRTYIKNMKSRANLADQSHREVPAEDRISISEEGMRRMLFTRIGEKMTERLRKHDQEE
jgi:hypothetical protein